MDDLTDKMLVSAACSGDRQAYAELIKRHYRRVFLTCLGMAGRTCDAEDLTQDTFLKGFTELRRLRDAAQFGPWICRIARNNSINDFRRRRRVEHSMDKLSDPPAGHEATHSVDLERALARLPDHLRQVLVMYYFDGQDVRKTADCLKISASNVYQRLRTALQQVHDLLIEQGDAR